MTRRAWFAALAGVLVGAWSLALIHGARSAPSYSCTVTRAGYVHGRVVHPVLIGRPGRVRT